MGEDGQDYSTKGTLRQAHAAGQDNYVAFGFSSAAQTDVACPLEATPAMNLPILKASAIACMSAASCGHSYAAEVSYTSARLAISADGGCRCLTRGTKY